MANTDELTGRVALVTGASGGIGRAIAERMLAAGAHVALHYSSSAAGVEEIVARSGSAAIGVQADLADADACQRLIAEVVERLGAIDVLVVNHGRGARRSGYADVSAGDWDTTMAINTRAAFLLAQATLPQMQAAGYGRILFTSSVAALTGGVVGPDYAASKAALHGLLHYLAPRVAADGVTVNAIAPALIEETGMLPGDPGELAKRIPVGRLGKPGEVADLAMAVLTNGYLTDHVFPVDGGSYPS